MLDKWYCPYAEILDKDGIGDLPVRHEAGRDQVASLCLEGRRATLPGGSDEEFDGHDVAQRIVLLYSTRDAEDARHTSVECWRICLDSGNNQEGSETLYQQLNIKIGKYLACHQNLSCL